MSWTNDVILEFIELYRKEPILWDPKHVNYKVKGEGLAAWTRIQSNLSIQCSVLDLKKKKESLMTTFRLHCSKKRKLPQFKSTWFAFPYLESFLGNKYECDSNIDLDKEVYTIIYHKPPNHGQSNSMARLKNPESPVAKKIPTKSKKVEEGSLKSDLQDSVLMMKDLNESSRREEEWDEYDLYAQLLAKKLRKLDEHQRDVAMHEIDNIMFRAKMQSRNSRNFVSSPISNTSDLETPIFIVTQDEGVNCEDYQKHEIQQTP